MQNLVIGAVTGALLLLGSSAHAQDTTSSTSEERPSKALGSGVLLGAKVGGVLPFGGLSPNARVGIEAGYVLPFMNGSIAAALDVDFAAPKSTGSQSGDARLMTGSYDWHLTEQELAFMPVVMYRLTSLGTVTPYIGIGPRIYLLRSTVKGSSGGATIAETSEESTRVGLGIPAGAELRLGPGAAIAELLFEYASLPHTATGPSNTGGLNLMLGYRFVL